MASACTEEVNPGLPDVSLPDTTSEVAGDGTSPDTTTPDGVTQPDSTTQPDVTTPDLPLVDNGPSDVVDTSIPDAPPTGCVPACGDGEVCLGNACVGSCGTTPIQDLLAGLAPGIDAVGNICKDNSNVWGWAVGRNGALYEVRSAPQNNNTRVGLWNWNWWDGDAGADAALPLSETIVSGSVDLWQVFPSNFVTLNDDATFALWGFATGGAGGSLYHTDLVNGGDNVIDAPGLFGGTVFSSFLLSTGSGSAGNNAGPGAYYYHNVLTLGGALVTGLGTAVGAIDGHKNEVLLMSGYNGAWADCGGTLPEVPVAGQRTYALPLSVVVERYTAATLPIDLACEGQVTEVPADFTFLADGRIATRNQSPAFELTGLSVHYWTLDGNNAFSLNNSVSVSVGDTFSDVRADPHSTKLLLKYPQGYLVVEGPPTQDPVVAPDPVEPDPGPEMVEPGPEAMPDSTPELTGEVMASDAMLPQPEK